MQEAVVAYFSALFENTCPVTE